jgi:hypothetical protein
MSIFYLAVLSATNYTATGISAVGAVGAALGVVCSWTRNRSVFWAFLAGLLGYFYVIYWIMTREKDELRY